MTQTTANASDRDESGALFLDIVARRRSMRDFKPDPVPAEIIASVFGGAQRAPARRRSGAVAAQRKPFVGGGAGVQARAR